MSETRRLSGEFTKLLGLFAWQVRRGADDVLRLDFGEPHLKVREPISKAPGQSQAVIDALERRMVIPTGEWHLFIFDADWQISAGSYTATRTDRTRDEALRQLDGQRLLRFAEISDVHWTMAFDLGGTLSFSRDPGDGTVSDTDNLWTLFRADRSWISCNGAGALTSS